MKLGVSYNVFDGEEMLEAAILSIRPVVDYINIIYQTTSYYGEYKPELTAFLEVLVKKGLVDEIYLYDKDFSAIQSKHNCEREKRDIGLELCKKQKCTHFLCCDADEFYERGQFQQAKEYIEAQNIETSACLFKNYIQAPIYAYYAEANTVVPFICKLKDEPQNHGNPQFPCLVDPTRSIKPVTNFYIFPKIKLTMHHMWLVRNNLLQKFKNSNHNAGGIEHMKTMNNLAKSAYEWSFEKNKLNDRYALFNGAIIEKVPNRFNITLSTTQKE